MVFDIVLFICSCFMKALYKLFDMLTVKNIM